MGRKETDSMLENRLVKRTWATVNLDHIAHNFRLIRQIAGEECKVMGVVKADGYGHGDYNIAKVLVEESADFLGVSSLDEALALRRYFDAIPILILGYTPPDQVAHLSRFHITQTVFSNEYADALSHACQEAGCQVEIHIKIDTGMSRIGFVCDQFSLEQCIQEASACFEKPRLVVKGIFTHFAVADELCEESVRYTRQQYQLFNSVCNGLRERGLDPGLRHCCNSGAVLNFPEMKMDMIRPGILLYGLFPSEEIRNRIDLRPAMELRSVVTLVKEIGPGVSVSYGRTYTSSQPMVLATVPIGYADGFPRTSQGACVLIHGQRAKVVGRVCMDQLMVDVTHIPQVKAGDSVVIFGKDGKEEISIEEFSSFSQTINYESICSIGTRVPRVYLKDGAVVDLLEYLYIK